MQDVHFALSLSVKAAIKGLTQSSQNCISAKDGFK